MFFAILFSVGGAFLLYLAHQADTRISSEPLSFGISTYLRGAGIVGLIVGGLFFLTVDWNTALSAVTPSSSVLQTFGWLCSACIAVWGTSAWLSGAHSRSQLKQDIFSRSMLTLSVDRAAGIVHISREGNIIPEKLGLGRLVVDVPVLDKHDERQWVQVAFLEWPTAPTGTRTDPDVARRRLRTVCKVDMPIATAKRLTDWLRYHPEVSPDEGKLRKEWTDECQALLRYCQQQRTGGGTPAVEAYRFTEGPAIAYLAIEQAGHVLSATGTRPALATPFGVLMSNGMKLAVDTDGGRIAFELKAPQVRELHRLQAKGLVIVENRNL
ncbi:hypothetical protein P3W24_06675 [Luteibacter sp. PPL201]|uniref:Uncharacterized protein n=1 Tax=Luteibacter sahnii TaxID=3021977 RepID=A0ABT6B998_9GAMM